MPTPTPIAIHGAAGRMGQAMLRLAFADPALRTIAAVVKGGGSSNGESLRDAFGGGAGELAFSDSLDAARDASVLIDFSVASAFDAALAFARNESIAFVSGTTGLAPAQHAEMKAAAVSIPILWSANFSIGVAVLTRLAREAAEALGDWDCEIAEAHHRQKKDAPSGTALALGRAVAAARGVEFDEAARFDRNGPREPATIGFSSVRAGDIVGEHAVVFAGEGERVDLVHRASDRDVFARGALRAAAWLAGRPPGLYALADIVEPRRR